MTADTAVLAGASDISRERLLRRYRDVRALTEDLAAPLAAEDQVVQTMADVSPTKWHRAHTAWFFETLLLKPRLAGYREVHPAYAYLFNSYYESIGPQFHRPSRGLLSRPTVAEVGAYRAHVDAAMERLVETADADTWREIAPLIELGLNHEQQHQELLLTDIKHVLSCNPLDPVYRDDLPAPSGTAPAQGWIEVEGGLREIGHDGDGFAYDNEGPRHAVYVAPFRLATRPVTNGEYLEFVADGGYRTAAHWLFEGWQTVRDEGWEAPSYWRRDGDRWLEFTLGGVRSLDLEAPVSHLSYFEADAFATWAGARLPTEAEWELAAAGLPPEGNLLEAGRLQPGAPETAASGPPGRPRQVFGDVWEWTGSAYAPYPGYRPPRGAVGEYNGKFMCGQMVLRGGSCVTPPGHIRATYRNFFPPDARWQVSGLRLAEDG
jgi:ergothioneine biosynthesis protein EgtB